MTNSVSNTDKRRREQGDQTTPPLPDTGELAADEAERSPSATASRPEAKGPLPQSEAAGDDAAALPDADDYWNDNDEEASFEDEPSEDAPDAGAAAPNARASVAEWHILSVGHRPTDYMARDCLFGALFRDHRAPWFRRYVKKPAPWMESLVAHLPDKADRGQALRYLALHFLHKLHLSRLLDFVSRTGKTYDEVGPLAGKTLRRLWNCTPYGVEVRRVGRPGKPRPGCNLSRLCPWCHARKVARLYEVLSKGPLRRREVLYLLLGKATPFAERMGGVDGSYQQADWQDYIHGGEVRGHWGRYFARHRDRLAHTRRVLAECLMTEVCEIGLGSGLWTHQLGSAQLESGQRTFLHDLALIAEVDADTLEGMPTDEEGKVFWSGRRGVSVYDAALEVLWLPLPADNPAALRVALAGTSVGYAVSRLGLPKEWFGADGGYRSGIPGALSWQPTFLFDDQMWFAYAEAVKNMPLYRPFGAWRESMASAAADVRSSIDRKFGRVQAGRFARGRQQKGNRRRGREARDRRAELLTVALGVWPEVVAEQKRGSGRPPRRKRLEALLAERGVQASRRDLDWLMGQLS